MSHYTNTAVCIVPAPLGIIAAAVGRALDPDVGGANSFVPVEGSEPPMLVTSTPVIWEYAAALPYLLADPAALLATIAMDRDTRWAGIELPTLSEVVVFCAAATLEIL